jgi:hypothetical protein
VANSTITLLRSRIPIVLKVASKPKHELTLTMAIILTKEHKANSLGMVHIKALHHIEKILNALTENST